MMDGETEICRVLFQNKINLRYCASGWFYYRNTLRCTVLQTSNSGNSLVPATSNSYKHETLEFSSKEIIGTD